MQERSVPKRQDAEKYQAEAVKSPDAVGQHEAACRRSQMGTNARVGCEVAPNIYEHRVQLQSFRLRLAPNEHTFSFCD